MSESFQRVSELTGFDGEINVLVIGASGGIGRALLSAISPMPGVSRLFAAARRTGQLDSLGKNIIAVEADVSEPASMQALAETICKHCQQLDLVIYAAGFLHDEQRAIAPERQLKQVQPEALQASFSVNAFGLLYAAQALQGMLPSKGRGVWANISARVGSIGDNGLGGWHSYRAAKAAQNMITRNLAIEWGRRNRAMTVLALHPGTTDTALSEPFQKNVPADKLFSPERAAHQLLAVINAHDGHDSGRFYDWANQPVEW